MRTKGLMASALAGAILLCITMVAPSWAASIPCTRPLGAVEIKGNISAGPGCDLSGATVRGNVTVNPGGELTTKNGSTTVITGKVESNDAINIRLLGAASIGGNLQLTGTGGERVVNLVAEGTVNGNVEIEGGEAFATVANEKVGGNVQILKTSGAGARGGLGFIRVDEDTVGGNVQLEDNSLAGILENQLEVAGTSVSGELQMKNNTDTLGVNGDLVFVLGNHVGGNAELLDNTHIPSPPFNGEPIITDVSENAVTNILNCAGNKPPPQEIGEPNTAKKKLGQCELL